MQSSSSAPPITKRSTLDPHGSSMNKPLLMTRLSTRNLYELQVKSANYEAMMQRFQLRRVSNSAAAEDKLKPAVIEAVGVNKGMPQFLSVREVILWLTRRRTWRHAWKFATSPIVPGGVVCTFHGLFMFSLNHFELFYMPFSYTFHAKGSIGTAQTGIALQLLHLVDLFLNLNTAFIHQRELMTRRSDIFCEYVNKWFLLELLSALPVDIVYAFANGSTVQICGILLRYDAVLMALRMFRLIFVEQSMLPKRLVRNKHLVSWLLYSRYSHLLGIAKLIWLVLLVAHYMACMWHKITEHPGGVGVGEQYIAAFYYAVQLIQGQGGATGSWEEHLFSTCVILIGSVILAIVFGNVAMLVSNFNANTTSYRQKMEGVFATMDKMALPLKLRERVHQYYTHVWMEYKSLDGDIVRFQRELAHTLGLEVGLYKYMNLVMKIPFWERCSPDFATQIILNLGVRVYLPDDYVVRKGETGDEMFMINRGICELTDPEKSQQPSVAILSSSGKSSANSELVSVVDEKSDGSTNSSALDTESEDTDVFRQIPDPSNTGFKPFFRRKSIDKHAHVYPHKNNYEIDPGDKRFNSPEAKNQILLYPGQAFGEMSLLMNYKRTANIRAATYVEICVFDRTRFQRIISRYPEDRRLVLKMMLKSCIEKKEIPFPWEEVVDAVAAKRRQNGAMGSSLLNVQATVTSSEAAQALVDRIDVNRPDESIKYGFQTFHPDLKNNSSEESTVMSRVGSNPHLRRESTEQSPKTSSSSVEPLRTKLPTAAGETLSAVSTQIQGLEKSIADMMRVMSSMSTSIDRLEKREQNGASGACCRCCPGTCMTLVEDDQFSGSIMTVDSSGEAREANYTKTKRPKRKLRRPSSTPNIIRDALKLNMNSPGKKGSNNQLILGARQRVSTGSTQNTVNQDNPESRFLSKALESPKLSATIFETQMPLTAVPRQGLDGQIFTDPQDVEVCGKQKQPRCLISKTKSPTKEPTLADQLWRRQAGRRGKRNVDDDDGAAKLSLIRTRSSLPLYLMVVSPEQQESLTGAGRLPGRSGVVEPCLTRTRSNLPSSLEVASSALAQQHISSAKRPRAESLIVVEPRLIRTRSNIPSNLEMPPTAATLLGVKDKLTASGSPTDHLMHAAKRWGSRVGLDALNEPASNEAPLSGVLDSSPQLRDVDGTKHKADGVR